MRIIPKAENNFTFELRENYRQIDDRKWHCIELILCHLRSSIFGALTRSNVKLFSAFGISRRLLFLLLPLSLVFFSGCQQYYLSICQEWVDVRYLASTHVGTPDPRQDHPPIGQKLIVDWRIPKEVFKEKPEVVLDLILWDYTTRQVHIPIKRRMDFATYRLFNEEYEKTGGILTYKAQIVTQDGKIFREWKHQLWVNLITIDQGTAEPAGVEKTKSAE